MAAASLTLSIDQGATFTRKLIFKDSLGALINLTGQTFTGMIKKSFSDTTALATFTCTVLNQTTNLGEVTVELTSAASSAIPIKIQKPGTRTTEDFIYDIERTYSTGVVERILEGIARISPEVTK